MNEIKTLAEMYNYVSQKNLIDNHHASCLKKIAQKCSSVAEVGVLGMNSTFCILDGLSKSPYSMRSYLGLDINDPPENILNAAKKWARDAEIDFTFRKANDLDITLDPVDFLHIDTYHTYRHLTYELETFASSVRLYILMHDTSPPWGYVDENQSSPRMDFESRYPQHIDRTKRGVWTALNDFLEKHPEWKIYERVMDSPGLTIIQRVGFS